MNIKENHVQFFTATILEWKSLLKLKLYKEIIIKSLKFLVDDKRIELYGYVIMPNHIHLIWRIANKYKKGEVQRDFLKYTAQQIKVDLQKNNPKLLEEFKVNAVDRIYQFWERKALSVDLFTQLVVIQKLDYIHANPIQEKWNLCKLSEEYEYSSARFYWNGEDRYRMLTSIYE